MSRQLLWHLRLWSSVILWFASSAWAVVLLKEALPPDDVACAVVDATLAQMIFGFAAARLYTRYIGTDGADADSLDVHHGSYFGLGSACNVIGAAATNWAIATGMSQCPQTMLSHIDVMLLQAARL